LAELEIGFTQWLDRVHRIARELNLEIEAACTESTFEKIQEYLKIKNSGVIIKHLKIEQADDLTYHTPKEVDSTMIFTILARKGAISSFNGIESLPNRLEKEWEKFDRVFVYPEQQATDKSFGGYEDMTASPIAAGVETIQRLSKGVGGIFKSSEEEK
jgi:hypothetical protein